ncbi:MAG: Na+/H+ antiporter NhaC [Brevinema sp.]
MKQISRFWILFPLFFIIVGVIFGTIPYGIPIEFLLFFGAMICCVIAYFMGFSWKEMEEAFTQKIASTWMGVLILILIGAIVGTWIYSGAVPMLIYYGVKWINPSFVPVTAFLVTTLVAIFTGTSWGAAATSGVAFIGIAQAVGIPLPLIAGAIISGAYVGDKNSPISDTTVLAAMGAGTNLLNHLKAMFQITVPAFFISILVFIVLGLQYLGNIDIATLANTQSILTILESLYHFNILLLLPALIVFVGSFKGVSPIITMFMGSIVALVLGAIFQDFGFVNGIKSFLTGFSVSMTSVSADLIPADLHNLLNRGGMTGMMSTVLFLISALTFGAMLQLIGTLQVILDALIKVIVGIRSLILVTWAMTFFVNSSVNSTQFTFLTLGPVLQNLYTKYRLHPSMLSRTMEDGGTLTEPITPWTVTGVYMATTLGVSTLSYLPYTVFNLVSILIMFVFTLSYPVFKYGTILLNEEKKNLGLIVALKEALLEAGIDSIDHCSTRIRINMRDRSRLDPQKIEQLNGEGISCKIVNDQLQIITNADTALITELLRNSL